MALAVFGINHKHTELDKLEQITFSPDEIPAALSLLFCEDGIEECVIISTCNRMELYTVCQEGFSVQQDLRKFMQHVKPACKEENLDTFYYKEGTEAIEHLFSVCSGLDSLVIGENEISGQIKEAYAVASQHKTNGLMTNKLFHAAFRTTKRVKNETKINTGNCSVGYVAVDMAEEIFPDIQQSKALLIGAGKIGRVVAKNFEKRNVGHLIIANRNLAKAERLAEEVGGTAISLDKIDEYIGKVDIMVSGTDSPEYLLRYEDMKRLISHLPPKPLLMVDIALPRDFDPVIGTLPNVSLKNLYDLKEVVDRNIKKRKQEVPKVHKIIREEIQKFLTWKESLKITATIKALTQHFEDLRLRELEKYEQQFPKEALSQVNAFTKSLTKKYIHLIVSNVKSLHEICELDQRQIHIIQHLFDCEGVSHERNNCRFKRQQSCAKTNTDGDRPSPKEVPVIEDRPENCQNER